MFILADVQKWFVIFSSLVTYLITNCCQVHLLGDITKNLKLYSTAQKIKSDSLAWLNVTCNPNASSSAFSFNTFQSVVPRVFLLSDGIIYAGSVLAGIRSYFGFKFYSVFSINLNCHPIQSLLFAAAFIHSYLLFIYSCIQTLYKYLLSTFFGTGCPFLNMSFIAGRVISK